MNVLGVIFDSKLTWSIHVANAINKAKKALFCTKTYKKIFYRNRNENVTRLKFLFRTILQLCDLAYPPLEPRSKTKPVVYLGMCLEKLFNARGI